MNELEITLDMLLSSLEKKKVALLTILNITENQLLLLEDKTNPAAGAMFNEMNKAKQEQIDMIIDLDKLFQSLFNGISLGFEEAAAPYGEKVGKIQEKIKEVLEMDIKIRASEQKNKSVAVELKKNSDTNRNLAQRRNIHKRYEQNKKPDKK